MAPPVVQLKVPNGVEIALPTGLFINNEFVESSSGAKLTSISPMCVLCSRCARPR